MEEFERLGDRVDRLWSERLRDERAFPEVAARALVEAPIDFAVEQFVLDVVERRRLPPQADERSTFGEPPVTVYAGDGFRVELRLPA